MCPGSAAGRDGPGYRRAPGLLCLLPSPREPPSPAGPQAARRPPRTPALCHNRSSFYLSRMVVIEMMPAHHASGARGLAMETKMPLVPRTRAIVCPQGWVLVPAIILRLLLARGPTLRCGLRTVVVSAEDLEHH